MQRDSLQGPCPAIRTAAPWHWARAKSHSLSYVRPSVPHTFTSRFDGSQVELQNRTSELLRNGSDPPFLKNLGLVEDESLNLEAA